MENKNNKKVSIIVLIAILLISTVSFTFAYFLAAVSGDTVTDVNLTIESSKVITFDSGDKLYLQANRSNFTSNYETLYSESTVSVSLISQVEEKVNYDISFDISSNEMIYTTEEEYAEVVLKITDNKGNTVTEIDGLTFIDSETAASYSSNLIDKGEVDSDTHITTSEIEGFDITTQLGEFTVTLEEELRTSSVGKHEWNFTLYFVNLDSEQDGNLDKKLSIDTTIKGSVVDNNEYSE